MTLCCCTAVSSYSSARVVALLVDGINRLSFSACAMCVFLSVVDKLCLPIGDLNRRIIGVSAH